MLEHELEEILYDLGLHKIKKIHGRKGTNFMFCCPFHGENRPSAGILFDGQSAYGQCYSCEARFSLAKLIAHCKGWELVGGINYLEEQYGVVRKSASEKIYTLKRWEDNLEELRKSIQRIELSKAKIAPFRSGKETHTYFFERGFTPKTAQDSLIGWDNVRNRITVPIFHADGVLAGVVGRAVLEPKIAGKSNIEYKKVYGTSPKYLIYDHFPIGQALFGAHVFCRESKSAIILEGTFDLLWMRQLGFTNSLSTIIAKNFTQEHMNILHELGVASLILMQDNDNAGEIGANLVYHVAKNDFHIYKVTYPEGANDVMDLSKKTIADMIHKKVPFTYTKFKRID